MPLLGNAKPEDILGMSQEDFKKKLDSAVTKDDLKSTSDSVEGIKSSLAELKEALSKLTSPKTEETKIEEPDPTDPTTAILTDPTGFIQKQTKGLADATAETQAAVQELAARQNPKYAAYFSQYGDELSKLASQYPAAHRARPGFWDFHIRTVIGDKAIKGEFKPGSFPSLLSSSSSIPNPTESENDPNKGFTSDMVDFYKKKNIPLEKARKIADLMQRDGEPITLENYKENRVH